MLGLPRMAIWRWLSRLRADGAAGLHGTRTLDELDRTRIALTQATGWAIGLPIGA